MDHEICGHNERTWTRRLCWECDGKCKVDYDLRAVNAATGRVKAAERAVERAEATLITAKKELYLAKIDLALLTKQEAV
jgi:hypothetical protein